MTETQINHRAPLAPGEIRKHTVGATTFRVMHVAGGSFTQVIYSINGQPVVICGTTWERIAVRAYADAIEQAESDRIDQLDDADGMSFDASGAYLNGSGLHRSGERGNVKTMLTVNNPTTDGIEVITWPLADLLDAYGEAMSRAAIAMTSSFVVPDIESARPFAARADALKAEILARFGGETCISNVLMPDQPTASDALESVDLLRHKLMSLGDGAGTFVLAHLRVIEIALKAHGGER